MTVEGLSIEKCHLEEIPQIALLEREAFTCPWTEEMFRQEVLLSPLSHMFVAKSGGNGIEHAVLGYLIFWLVGDEFHLHRIAVKRDLYRRGIASALLTKAFTYASQYQCRRATLEVRRSNVPALQFYKRFGFAVEGIRHGYYDDTGEDALILWADLPDSLLRDQSCPHGGIQVA